MKRGFKALALVALVTLVALVARAGGDFLGWGKSASPKRAPSADVPGGGFLPEVITLREVKDSDLKELFDEKLVFVDSTGVEWVAPQGTRTDGASVPRLALPVTDGRFDKAFLKAAVVHDAYCQSINETFTPDQYRTRKWQDVHRMFYEASVAGGASENVALVMFAAVWLGGPRWDDPEHSLDEIPDARLEAEFEACKDWIGRENPTLQEVEAWMERREQALRASPHPSHGPGAGPVMSSSSSDPRLPVGPGQDRAGEVPGK
jgi:Protein of unknown function (DUF1353)